LRPLRPKVLAGALSFCLIAVHPGPSHGRQSDPAPDATATFAVDTVALGVGYSWGDGRLTFDGHDHHFKVSGLTLVGAGAERIKGQAEIRHLRKLEDFEGVYVLAGASGSFVVLSGATAVLRNAKGVEIRLRAQGQGLSLAVAAGGARVKLG